jgi:molybdopterin synthase sulfur carrier subunit
MEHEVWIPALHRDLTNGVERVKVSGETIGEIIDSLDQQFPGLRERLVEEDRIRSHISVAINDEITHRRLHQRLTKPSEIHFVPAISGG